MKKLLIIVTFVFESLLLSYQDNQIPKNKVAGTWMPVKATVESNGMETFPYGSNPKGRLIFTPEMQFLEFIIDSEIPSFESKIRGEGSDEENRILLNGSLALYGTYTVDDEGNFTGNQVAESSFPNWTGNVRTSDDLSLVFEGDIMTEFFYRPSGAKVVILGKRAE